MRVKIAAVLCVLMLLTGCKGANEPLDRALALRSKVSESSGCSFSATVTADYGEKIYVFSMDCKTDHAGNLEFSVTSPATIAGITGRVSASGGAITFDDKVLAFQTIADGQVSPVTAPWLFIKALRSGYLKDCKTTDSGLEISIDDTYAEDALFMQITTVGDSPISAEIFWKGRRCLTVKVDNFLYL